MRHTIIKQLVQIPCYLLLQLNIGLEQTAWVETFSQGTILGGRTALTVTFFGSLIALLWGGLLGIFCGLVGGKIDDVVMRVVDAFLSIPWILAMLLIVSLLGTSTQVLIPALGFFYGKGIVRVARAATHDVIAKDFIVSARARGHSNMSIIWNEIIPNVRDAILVEGAMRLSLIHISEPTRPY